MSEDKRLLEIFKQLCVIPGESFKEEEVIKYIKSFLSKYKIESTLDYQGKKYNSKTTNLFCTINPSKKKNIKRVLLLAHTDTVATSGRIVPVRKDNFIKSKGETILGADNRAGISLFLRLVEEYYTRRLEIPEVSLLFTFGEEAGLCGTKAFNFNNIKADFAILFDHCGAFGEVVVKTPYHKRIFAEYIGKRTHAGVEPEKGVNAISIASKVINSFKFGRIDHQTVWNVGKINGGIATNVVPDLVKVDYEARSIDKDKVDRLINRIDKKSKKIARLFKGEYKREIKKEYSGYIISNRNKYLKQVKSVMKKMGIKLKKTITCGGSDANILFENNIPCLNMSCGIYNPHSYKEKLDITDFNLAYQFLKKFLVSFYRGTE
ncbi:MAG: M20/M25/M40 family metallo-hydrolase [Candidatus Hydrogenedentota bacterium]